MMKVTVTKFLNVRVGKPSLNATCYQYIAPGSEIEVDGKLYKGDKDDGRYEGIDTWYKDEAGNYYWSGGVSIERAMTKTFDCIDLCKAMKYSWIKRRGENVKIIIIDSGVVFNKLYFNENRFTDVNLVDANNQLHHGQFIMGLIGGNNNIKGLANSADITSIKYFSNTSNLLENRLNKFNDSLNLISKLEGYRIVNFSQGFFNFQLNKYEELVNSTVDKIKDLCGNRETIIVCSAGDNLEINDGVFPALLNECISVGTINSNNRNLEFKNKLDILTPSIEFQSYDNNFNTITDFGSSYSTAIITALIASFISDGKKQSFTKDIVLEELKRNSIPRANFDFEDTSLFQYCIL